MNPLESITCKIISLKCTIAPSIDPETNRVLSGENVTSVTDFRCNLSIKRGSIPSSEDNLRFFTIIYSLISIKSHLTRCDGAKVKCSTLEVLNT